MYTDTILFIVGAVCAVILIASAVYFVISSLKNKDNKDLLRQETEYYKTTMKKSTLKNTSKDSSRALRQTNNSKVTKKLDESYNTDPLFKPDNADNTDYTVDTRVFDGKYELKEEIIGGGMSRVFIARNVRVDNKWIIKFIPHKFGAVTYEYEKLKDLHNISLPKIVDIFDDKNGVYIVEQYIEGITLEEAMEFEPKFNYFTLTDYMTQLCTVYSYLHSLPDSPIYHLDIKPSNIMVTYGDRLVPIDFGISKRANDSSQAIAAVSPSYAAPEQFGNTTNPEYLQTMAERFGKLPADYVNWQPDARTDIFSLGVLMFNLVTGGIPTVNNMSKIKDFTTPEFSNIILKCLKINPAERYQTMDEILIDLQNLTSYRRKIHTRVLMRRIAAVIAVLAFVLSGSSFVSASYIYQQEKLSTVGVEPQYITISLQQSSELKIKKQMPNKHTTILNPSELKWTANPNNIAQIDGNRIAGINVGKTTIEGKYRNKLIDLNVNVVEPMDGMVDIVQRYELKHKVTLYGRTTERDQIDGALDGEAEFVSPESIDLASDGTIYVADSGVLRKIQNNTVTSIDIQPPYMTPHIVRCHNNDLYILTSEWQNDDGSYSYGIIRLKDDNTAENIYVTDAIYTAIEDFGFSPNNDNLLYFIERNAGLDEVYLKTINLQNTSDINTVCKLPKGTTSLTFGDDSTIYLANSETGVIQSYKNSELKYFAGVENEKEFIDGSAPLFYIPQKIKYADNALYVWDFNVLRKITIANGTAVDCITLAGEASPDFDLENIEKSYNAEDVIMANSELTDFVNVGGYVLVTDPKRGVIWKVE